MIKSIRTKIMVMALVIAVAVAAPITVPFTGNGAVAEAASVKISSTKITLLLGDLYTPKITGTKSKVTWKTSNKSVATVSATGEVAAMALGTAKITATVNKKNYTCTITVVTDVQEVQIGGLAFYLSGFYKVSGKKVADGQYQADLKRLDSHSKITVLIKETGAEAVSYDELITPYADLSEESLQASYDTIYGAGKTTVADLSVFSHLSINYVDAFVYSFILTTSEGDFRINSYNMSIDGYDIEVVSRDLEGYDIYIDAERLIDTLTYDSIDGIDNRIKIE